jgi:pre-mRNA-splicing factor SYF1
MKFEESVIGALMQDMNDDDDDDEMKKEEAPMEEEAEDDLDILLGETENHGTDADVELALARAEHLTARRPLLLNGVLLRQNPHNVGEWLRRSELYLKMDQLDRAAMALMEASQKVHARRAINGMPSTLFITLASIYEDKLQQLDQARHVFSDVCHEGSYHFKEVDDLAQLSSLSLTPWKLHQRPLPGTNEAK